MLTRATWLKYHLYLALGAGFFFALLGLTGSLSVYREELDEILNPRLVVAQPEGEHLSLDRIMDAVRKAHPNRYGAWTLEIPRSPRGMVTAWYDNPHETVGEYYAPLMVSVNPYTAEVVASRFWGRTATTWLLDLHTQLRLDGFGTHVVGVLGLLLMTSVGTGLYLWWPGMGRLSKAFTVRRNAGMARLAFDLHRLIGLFSAVALLLLAFTGFQLSYPKVLEAFVGSSGLSHGNDGPKIRSTAVPNDNPVSLADADFIARSLFPRAELRRITTPRGDAGVYRVNFRQGGELNQRHPFTVVWVDRWTGQIKEVRNPYRFSRGESFATWMWPLHTGEAFGAMGRFLWFLAGQALFLLYVSGLLYWLQRRGSIRDRPVNLAALRPYWLHLKAASYRAGLATIRVVRLLIRMAVQRAPSTKVGNAILSAWMRRIQSFMAHF